MPTFLEIESFVLSSLRGLTLLFVGFYLFWLKRKAGWADASR